MGSVVFGASLIPRYVLLSTTDTQICVARSVPALLGRGFIEFCSSNYFCLPQNFQLHPFISFWVFCLFVPSSLSVSVSRLLTFSYNLPAHLHFTTSKYPLSPHIVATGIAPLMCVFDDAPPVTKHSTDVWHVTHERYVGTSALCGKYSFP